MKKGVRKLLPSILMCVVGIAVIVIGTVYFQFISQRIYEDSTSHLQEIYGQVNRSFVAFAERNWGILEGCSDYLALTGDAEEEMMLRYIRRKQEYWGFTDFYFLAEDESCMTADGAEDRMDLGGSKETLLGERTPVMTGETRSDGVEITLFAVPVLHSSYRGFDFDAIAISYTNADMAASLNVDAFAGKAQCFVVHKDGTVLVSTQAGGNIFDNYLTYLRAASDLSGDDLNRITADWQDEKTGLLQCRIGDVSHCIWYQPVGYQD